VDVGSRSIEGDAVFRGSRQKGVLVRYVDGASASLLSSLNLRAMDLELSGRIISYSKAEGSQLATTKRNAYRVELANPMA